MSASRYSELWVCFVPPPVDPPPNAMVLSFMSPGEEHEAGSRWGSRFISGREVARQVRSDARRLYIDLIARIGATPCVDGKTLRQVLKGPDGYSRWWFHKMSDKDCVWDEDPTYLSIIRLLCVRRVADQQGITHTRVFGGSPEFTAALTGDFPGHFRASVSIAKGLAFGILSRLVFLKDNLYMRWLLRNAPPPTQEWEVALQGHWDWSIYADRDGRLSDRYFRDLPHRLEQARLRVGWFAWCEPHDEILPGRRPLREVVNASLAHPQVVLLERYLGIGDILSVGMRIRYFAKFLRFLVSPGFRKVFLAEGFDIYPVMRWLLIRWFADAGICRRELLMQATARACRHLRPKVLLTFHELFLHTRAMYAGARLASSDIKLWTAQHGAYCSDKTIGALEPVIEFKGKPDGCGVMAPQRVYAMGELAGRIWVASGFPTEDVIVTGGLRYQHVRVIRPDPPIHRKPETSVLLVCAMNETWDLDMCEAAVLAASGIPSVRLRFRDHPHYRLTRHRRFARFQHSIEVTTGTVDEDLADTDLVLFTFSGLAEEALLRGLPVWQWGWAGFNPSVFDDLPVIPTFSSVRALRDALQSFVQDPEPFRPTPEVQETVLRACFGPAPAQASTRIAEDIVAHVRGSGVLTSGSAKAR